MFEFKKLNRLLKGAEFKHVLDSGLKVVHPYFVVYAAEGLEQNRLGLIVSKKVGKAVKRNKIKRRLRESFRMMLPTINEDLRCDFVVIARNQAVKANFLEFDRSLINCIERLRARVALHRANAK